MGKDYFDIKNEYFLNFLDDLFNINKSRNWDDIAKSVTLLKIKRTYRVFAELFLRKFNYLDELEKTNSTFSSLHYGALKGSRIIDEVTRFSLYADKILVFHPLQNPAVTNLDLNPGKKPKYWLPDFLDALYFYVVIQKWVKSGIVKLIINPCEYDLGLRSIIDAKTHERLNGMDKELIFEKAKKEVLTNLAESFSFNYSKLNREQIVGELLGLQSPKFSIEDAEELATEIFNSIPKLNPLYKKLNIPLNGGMIVPTKGGGSLDAMMVVAEKTGASIYTPSDAAWFQMQKAGLDDFWSKASHLYSRIPLNFLNNVDTGFALEIRKEERLAGVRKQLKRIYTELNSTRLEDITEARMRDLHDSFIEEVRTAESEWNDIKKQAEIARKHWLATTIGIPIVINEISVLPLAIGSAAWLYKNETSRFEKEKLQRVKNPISVFVDLKNQRQGGV